MQYSRLEEPVRGTIIEDMTFIHTHVPTTSCHQGGTTYIIQTKMPKPLWKMTDIRKRWVLISSMKLCTLMARGMERQGISEIDK